MERIIRMSVTGLLLASLVLFTNPQVNAQPAPASPVVTIVKPLEVPGVGTLLLPAWMEVNDAVLSDGTTRQPVQYDLSGKADGVWHYARLMVYHNSSNIVPMADMLLTTDVQPEILQALSGELKDTLAANLAKTGARILDWYPLEKVTIGNRRLLAGSCLLVYDKLPLPMFTQIYFFTNKNQLVGLALIGPDSDKKFMTPLYTQLISKL
ncbi:Hypothetical protein LUCI_2893 [Lucifera butyrica]|uniref:Uncharacterized protein n=1 Tax=Lucifera butyrica TaxID=1351585 RepID=A0A498REM2_9FIRM|nr:hypothetical protein [Lucifera butyrica]VBB07628.1 Hypothetical protein LUCI_2893 [Lucifera butyrica]